MEEKPLDLETHDAEPPMAVWKRRALFGLLIVLCVAFAAPTFGSCSGALGSGGAEVWGTFTVDGRERVVRADEFERVFQRHAATVSLFFSMEGRKAPDVTATDVWDQIILDEVAKAEGVHVSDAQIVKFLGRYPDFQTAGAFDERKYREVLSELGRNGTLDHESLTAAIRSILRVETYRRVFRGAFELASSSEAYEAWKKTNLKLTVDWVAQPYDAVRSRVEALPITDADLKGVATAPPVLEARKIGARRAFEVAFVRTRELTAEQRAAMETFVAASGLLGRDETVNTLSWQWYWSNRNPGEAFSRDVWLRSRTPAYVEERTRWEAEHKAWQARPEAERGPEPKAPEDPAQQPWPEKPADVYEKYWAARVRAEVLAKIVVRHMALRAERESKSFAELAPDYAALGVRVAATTEPLADADLVDRSPEGLGRDSELPQVVLSRFRMPEDGAAFVPKVAVEPVPTTRLSHLIDERGWMVLRWTALDPARERDVLDVREKAEEYLRSQRVTLAARDVLVELRKKVEAAVGDAAAQAAAFRAEAAAAGLEVRTLRRFHRESSRPTPPIVTDASTPAERASAATVARRNRVQDDYGVLSRTDVGKFRDPVLLDETTQSAYLMLLIEKHEPLPAEMDEATLSMQRMMARYREQQRVAAEVLAGEALAKRYALELTEAYLSKHKPVAAPKE